MARGTQNSATRLILRAPFRLLGIPRTYIDTSPFLSWVGTPPNFARGEEQRSEVDFLIPIVEDIIVRKQKKISRSTPVRQGRFSQGTFKEFINVDDYEVVVDAMMTYHYKGEVNLKGDDELAN